MSTKEPEAALLFYRVYLIFGCCFRGTDLQCSFELLEFFLGVFLCQVPFPLGLLETHLQSVVVVAKGQRQLDKRILLGGSHCKLTLRLAH